MKIGIGWRCPECDDRNCDDITFRLDETMSFVRCDCCWDVFPVFSVENRLRSYTELKPKSTKATKV